MRISDWSSDVCSSDLLVTNISFCEILVEVGGGYAPVWIIKIVLDNCFYRAIAQLLNEYRISSLKLPVVNCFFGPGTGSTAGDRTSVVEEKRVSVRVDLGRRRILKKKKITKNQT